MSEPITAPDGTVSLDGDVPRLSPANEALFRQRVVDRWAPLAAAASSKWNVPLSWILAVIWAESMGNPGAEGHDPGGTIGKGLMQLTSSAALDGLTGADAYDPEKNIDKGTRLLSIIKARWPDLPRVAAGFNAGSPRPSSANRWGWVSTGNYLDRVVSASNTAIALGVDGDTGPSGVATVGERIVRGFLRGLAILGLGGGAYLLTRGR